MTGPKRLAVFAVKESNGKSTWIRAGTAWTNRDGSLNVYLDVLPLDGKLHIREALTQERNEDHGTKAE